MPTFNADWITQSGSITLGSGVASNTDTLSTEVDTDKYILVPLGRTVSANMATQYTHAIIELTNGTTVTATRAASDANTVVVNYMIFAKPA